MNFLAEPRDAITYWSKSTNATSPHTIWPDDNFTAITTVSGAKNL